jgi:hypothetical protein
MRAISRPVEGHCHHEVSVCSSHDGVAGSGPGRLVGPDPSRHVTARASPLSRSRVRAPLKLPLMTDDHEAEVWTSKDGRVWRMGREADVAWIRESATVSFAITSAIPPIFEAYATLKLPGSGDHDARSPLEDPDRHNAGVLAVLSEHSAAQPWWLGYLDTGGADIVFYNAPKVRPGPTSDGWYVLVEAGPEQAGVWREQQHSKDPLPDLMLPADRAAAPRLRRRA